MNSALATLLFFALTAGLSQSTIGRSGPVSVVFLCPVTGTPTFGVADGNRTPTQVGNTVAGSYSPERTPNPGKGFNLSKFYRTMSKIAARKGTATRAQAPQIEGTNVLTLYRQANLPGAPIAESGPVACLSFVPTTAQDDPNFWAAYTIDKANDVKSSPVWHPFPKRNYFIVSSTAKECTIDNVLKHFRHDGVLRSRESIVRSCFIVGFIEWCNAFNDGLMWAMRNGSDVVHIVDPEAYLAGRTLDQFAKGVLYALYGEGAFYDLSKEASS